MIENNICLLTDSYKVTHHYFYPKGTEKIYSYLESRLGAEFNKTIFYGLQYIIKKYLEGQVVNQQKIEEADKLISNHIGEDIFNKKGWYYILDEYDGYLPIEIKSEVSFISPERKSTAEKYAKSFSSPSSTFAKTPSSLALKFCIIDE